MNLYFLSACIILGISWIYSNTIKSFFTSPLSLFTTLTSSKSRRHSSTHLQSTPRIAVRPLVQESKENTQLFEVTETPIHKTKTIIINCDSYNEPFKPTNRIWNLEYTPGLSSKF